MTKDEWKKAISDAQEVDDSSPSPPAIIKTEDVEVTVNIPLDGKTVATVIEQQK